MEIPLLWRTLAAAVLLAVPADAVVESGSLSSILALARSSPAFRASLLAQVQLATALSASPAPSLAPLAAAAPTAADPWLAESARLVGALVAQPEAIAAHQDELRAALGDYNVDLLQKSSARFHAREDLAAQLADLRRGLDFSDPASLSGLGARLNALFENARAGDGAAVAADGGGSRKPLVSLVKPGERPAMSHAELEDYVARNSIVSPRGLKRVNFASGDYRPEYEAALRRLGVDVAVVKAPSRAEIAKLKEEAGWHLKSEYERWVMTTRSLAEHEKTLGKGQRIRHFQKELAASDHVPIETAPLTVEKYEQWYQIYEDEVVGKPGGKRNVTKDFARELARKGALGEWQSLFYYDPADRARMIGGAIMKAWPERGMFVIGYAAYRPQLKDASPSVRTFAESMKLALTLGFKVLSFGQDTNFFGYDYNLGLMSNKAGFLLTPYPEDEVVLMKVLDTSKIASVKNKAGQTGGYFFFGIPRASPLVERYLASREAGRPQEAQELLGSPRYFTPEILPPNEATVAWYFKGDDPNPVRIPPGIEVRERRMAEPSSGN